MFAFLEFDYDAVEAIVGHTFKDRESLKQACTHGSYKNSMFRLASDRQDNERLEFLGDAALGVVVSELLFKKASKFDPGALTQTKAGLVSNPACAQYTLFLGLHKHLRKVGQPTERMLANQFEAVVGALWLEGAQERIRSLVFDRCYPIVAELLGLQGSKKILHRYCEKIGQAKPVWAYSQTSGGITATVQLEAPDPGCSANAGSEEEAEEQAGAAMLQRLKGRYCETSAAPKDNHNYKSELQERFPGAIEYRLVQQTGSDHRPNFEFEVLARGKVIGTGKDSSKKAAQQAAAKDAIEKLQ